jgi:hypothetical protein
VRTSLLALSAYLPICPWLSVNITRASADQSVGSVCLSAPGYQLILQEQVRTSLLALSACLPICPWLSVSPLCLFMYSYCVPAFHLEITSIKVLRKGTTTCTRQPLIKNLFVNQFSLSEHPFVIRRETYENSCVQNVSTEIVQH